MVLPLLLLLLHYRRCPLSTNAIRKDNKSEDDDLEGDDDGDGGDELGVEDQVREMKQKEKRLLPDVDGDDDDDVQDNDVDDDDDDKARVLWMLPGLRRLR